MRRAIAIGAGLALLLAAAGLVRVAARIERESARDETQPADAIVILGAAEYRGKPSPVLRARLDHGLELYRRNIAPLILTTGGAGGDPVFTEGEVGREYLVRRGVPSEAISVEAAGGTTVQSLKAAAEILRRMGLKSCVVVSDGYHIYRAKRILEAEGFRVYGSPRPAPLSNGAPSWWLYLRQAAGYLLWSVGIRI